EPLLHHPQRLLVGDVVLEARQHPVVGARVTPRLVLCDFEILACIGVGDQRLAKLLVVVGSADVLGKLVEQGRSLAVDHRPLPRDVRDVATGGAGGSGAEAEEAATPAGGGDHTKRERSWSRIPLTSSTASSISTADSASTS